MKKKLTFLLTVSAIFTLSILQLNVNAQTSWQWAANAGNSTEGNGNYVAVDNKGNVYVAGSYTTSSITFGTITLTNNNPGYDAVFVVKYNASGNVMWAHSAGGTYYCYGLSVAVDVSDNVYFSGYFRSEYITFGAFTLTNTGASAGNSFLVKYDSSGNALWARNPQVTGNPTSDAIGSISANSGGAVYVEGTFQANTITFGSYTLTNTDNTFQDVFVVKYDTSGSVKWAKNAGGTDGNEDVGESISSNSSGEAAVTGTFASSYITFGSTNLVNSNAGDDAVFIVKYDSSGNVLWANSAGGDNDDYGLCVGIDEGGNVYASGYFKSPTITFGSYTLVNTGEPAGNIFLVKYSPSGNVLWAKNPSVTGSITSDAFSGMSVNASGIYLSGQFQAATIQFGTPTLTNTDPTYQDILLVKYDTTGNAVWAKNIGGTDGYNDDAVCISANNKGNVGVTGFYATSYATFGSTNIVNSNTGSNDIFIADMYDSTATSGISTVAGSDSKITVYPNPNNGAFSIQLQNLDQNSQLEIFNVLGENVYTAPLSSVNIQINLSNHPAGMYLYRIVTTDGQFISNGKFVVE